MEEGKDKNFGNKDTEGMRAATLIGEARAEFEEKISSPDCSFTDLRWGLPIFMRPSAVRVALESIRVLENHPRIKSPWDCPSFMDEFIDTYYQELQLRGQFGKPGITHAGLIRGKKKTKVRTWERASAGESLLIQDLRGGMDVCWIGDREWGKTDAHLHYVVVPWMKEVNKLKHIEDQYNHSICGIKIDNRDEWKDQYHYRNTDVDLLIKACEILENTYKIQEDVPKEEIFFPRILMTRDDIAASGVTRKRAGSPELVNLEYLGYVSRHFGLASAWIFQYFNTVPTSIRDFTSRWFQKLNLKTMKYEIHFANYTEIEIISGLKGRAQRKKNRLKYDVLDYYPTRFQVTAYRLEMVDVMMHINHLERKAEMKGEGLDQIGLYAGVREFLQTMMDVTSIDKAMERDQLLKSVSYVYELAKTKNNMNTLSMSYGALSWLMSKEGWNVSKRQVELSVNKIRLDMKENPDKWIPTPKNKQHQRDLIENTIVQKRLREHEINENVTEEKPSG